MPLDTENYNNTYRLISNNNYFIPATDFQMMPNQINIDETIKTFEPSLRHGPIETNEKEGVSALLMMMNAPPPIVPVTMVAKAEKIEPEMISPGRNSDSEGDHSEAPHYIYLGTSGPSDMIDDFWEGKFQELLDFIKANPYHDHLRKARVVNKELYHWIESQRNAYKDGRLAPAKIDRLNTIDFPWKNRKGRQSISNKRIPELRGFFERYGHWDVPKEKFPELFSWVTNQRWFKKKGTISKDTERQLNEIGFDWRIKNSRKKSEEEQDSTQPKRKESPVHETVSEDFMKRYRRRLDEFSDYSPYNNRDM